ncbi:methylated-DNA--[protein]-cysteine S-methyltransferase [Macrococcus carouselicus]|uniref:Methylated-DNA--protein-cysteine methyltransferase n=1 Tax=Macrococcus carouselicus TaxID=69969 RepID=A0A9Q8CFH3_9STAP|nr:methylated-DNA--[protein]-cysteine S-methyltransferase [Macrococcus carouselicus]TDL96598.1 methylated-DNA--[protein]-cysteine S-methyltransferase [Macrococcus carouselicus]
MKTIYRSDFELLDERFVICASDSGICSFSHKAPEFKEAEWVIGEEADRHNSAYINDLTSYAVGTPKEFDWSYDLPGTSFQQAVWHALQTIPYGQTMTYSEIAEQIGRPKAVRAVGGAIGRNPVLITIPCHRVIGKNGRLTGFSSGLHLKRRLLDIEGIPYYD